MLHCNIATAARTWRHATRQFRGGRTEDLENAGLFLPAWQAKPEPSIEPPLVVIFAGNLQGLGLGGKRDHHLPCVHAGVAPGCAASGTGSRVQNPKQSQKLARSDAPGRIASLP